jgi:hypothetical protein
MIIIAFAAAAMMAGLALSLALIVISVHREDRRGELPCQAPTAMTRSVRNLTGLRVCRPERACLYPKTTIRQQAPARHCTSKTDPRTRSASQSRS